MEIVKEISILSNLRPVTLETNQKILVLLEALEKTVQYAKLKTKKNIQIFNQSIFSAQDTGPFLDAL
jgi:hypothetical protein